MSQIPGMPGSQVQNDGDLLRMVQDLQRDMRELKAQDPFRPMGITPNANGFDVSGNQTVSGNLTVNGNLAVPNGSVSNDALNSPVAPAVAHANASNFSIANYPTFAQITSATVNVPAGYTRALVFATSELSAYNSTTAPSSIYLDTKVNGIASNGGSTMTSSATAKWYAFLSITNTQLLTGLGSSFVISAWASADSVWAANTYNLVNLNATVLFLR